ncbi:MAG: methyltransferase domain-containing protein [Caldilineaceae bacterium]
MHFHHCGAYQLPIETNTIDIAVVLATLSQILNKALVLTELRRIIKPGGRLVVGEELPDPAYLPPQITQRYVEAASFTFSGQLGSFFCYNQIFVNAKDAMTVDGVATVITID